MSDRSELESLSNNAACDVIGLVTYVGRIERVKSKGTKGTKMSLLFFAIVLYLKLTLLTLQGQRSTGRIAGSTR